MVDTSGRRALAKQATARTIRRTAMSLFLERGFDAVTTTEVARAAGVSPATLFNYYATKEDLFFGQVEELEQALVEVVRTCRPGQSLLAALRGHVIYELTAGRAQTDPAAIAPFHRELTRSGDLLAREAAIYARRESVLADALVDALGGRADPLPAQLAAGLYVAAERLIAGELRRRLKRSGPKKALRELEPYVDAVFAALGDGLGPLPVSSAVGSA